MNAYCMLICILEMHSAIPFREEGAMLKDHYIDFFKKIENKWDIFKPSRPHSHPEKSLSTCSVEKYPQRPSVHSEAILTKFNVVYSQAHNLEASPSEPNGAHLQEHMAALMPRCGDYIISGLGGSSHD